jgi:hypothetical protein
LEHLKFVLDEELVVLVENDFVTVLNGFITAVNVDCNLFLLQKGNRLKHRT